MTDEKKEPEQLRLERRSCGHAHHPKDGPCVRASQIPEGPAPRRGISSATATVLGLVAALAEPMERPAAPGIRGGEQCTNCGLVGTHSDDCRPPRGYRKVT